VTRRADRLVAERLPLAAALGERISDLTEDPEAFTGALEAGLRELADPVYAAAQPRVAPGGAPVIGVRVPLLRAVERPLRGALRETSSASALWLAQRLIPEPLREVRGFAIPALRRSMPDDPERSWQALRRLGAGARDWIEVDGQADVWASGILAETFRWAELEQLAYSLRPMERRLVGSVLARLPHLLPRSRRGTLEGPTSERALSLVRTLIGDADPRVQKALAWALREWAIVDPAGVTQLLETESRIAVERADAHRASVLRGTLRAVPAPVATRVRPRLAAVRGRRHAPPTSQAATGLAGLERFAALAGRAVGQQGRRYGRRDPRWVA
jgi:hypothetical protein